MILRDYQERMISDIHSAWLHGYKRPCAVMPCGAGKSLTAAEIARRTTANGKRVLFLVHRQELCEQIFSTFCSYGVDMMLCEVGMVQTISRNLSHLLPPALIITDENHHCLAASYRKIYDYFPDTYCLGFTATPIRLNGGGLGEGGLAGQGENALRFLRQTVQSLFFGRSAQKEYLHTPFLLHGP